MKRVLLILPAPYKKYPEYTGNFVAASDSKVEFVVSFLDDFLFVINGTQASIRDLRQDFDVADFDSVMMWLSLNQNQAEMIAIAAYCRKRKVHYADDYIPYVYGDFGDKLGSAFVAWEHGLNVPDTLFGSHQTIAEHYDHFELPVILKSVHGGKGNNNYLIHDAAELQQILESNPDTKYVLQQFIPNDGDYRVLVFGGKPTLVIYRRASGNSHLNNTSQGGTAKTVDLSTISPAVKTLAKLAAHVGKVEIAGVDIMLDKDTGEPYLLEVNRLPQIASGSFIDDKLQAYRNYFAKLNTKKSAKTSISPTRVVGITELVSFGNYAKKVPAKIDTGADSSAIWASNIRVTKNGVLRFSLFGEGSEFYTGERLKRTDFEAAQITSSNGKHEIRYRVTLAVKIRGKTIHGRFYLSDRSHNKFPVLIGRRMLNKKFVVDVSKKSVSIVKENKLGINAKLRANPYEFHKQYVRKVNNG